MRIAGANMKSIFAFLISSLFVVSSLGAELNGVTYEDKIKVGDKELVLNGLGLRKVTYFGFPIKVYVGALYVSKKTMSSDDIINSVDPKQVVIQFLVAVDRDKLIETFGNTYTAQCMADCANASKQFVQLRNVVNSVRKGDQMIFLSYPDKLVFEIKGANAKRTEIADANISKNAISMFLNPKSPPTLDLLNGLLGKKVD